MTSSGPENSGVLRALILSTRSSGAPLASAVEATWSLLAGKSTPSRYCCASSGSKSMPTSRFIVVSGYIPPTPEAVTLQSPELPIHVEHQPPATFGQVLDGDLAPQTLAGLPAA